MTAVVGVAHSGRVILGADRARTIFEDMVLDVSYPKVWSVGELVIGAAGDERQRQVLVGLDVPSLLEGDPDEWLDRWMAGPFVDALRNCLSAGGALGEDDGMATGPRLLVGVRGRLYLIDNAFATLPFEEHAIGAGGGYALGALGATRDLGMEPGDRVVRALGVAARLHPNVLPPFDLVATPDPMYLVGERGPELVAMHEEAMA